MALNKCETGDTITQILINNRGIRKGTNGEIGNETASERETGDFFFNTTYGFPQVSIDGSADDRGNLAILIGADSTEVSITGVTPTQVKDLDYIKSDEGFSGNQLTIVAMLKTDVGNADLRVRTDSGGGDDLILSTNNTTFTKVTGTIDIVAKTPNTVHTIEFFLNDDTSDTATLEQLEVYGI
jgi:hypothetical protein